MKFIYTSSDIPASHQSHNTSTLRLGLATDTLDDTLTINELCLRNNPPLTISNNTPVSVPKLFNLIWNDTSNFFLTPELHMQLNLYNYRASNFTPPLLNTLISNLSQCDYGYNGNFLKISYIREGMKTFEIAHEHLKKDYNHTLSSVLTVEKFHKCSVYQLTPNFCHILTNRLSRELLTKILGLIPAFFTNTLTTTDNVNYPQLFEALFTNNPALLQPFLTTKLTNYRYEQRKQTTQQFVENLNQHNNLQKQDIEARINQKQAQITDYLNEITNLQNDIDQYRGQWFLLETSPNANHDDIINLLLHMPHVQLNIINNNVVVFEVSTNITNYRRRDVEDFFKRPQSLLNDNNGPFAQIIKDTFINNKYSMILQSRVQLDFTNLRNVRISGIPPTNNHMSNPHIHNLNCFPNYKILIKQCLQNNDWESAISGIISACSTLVFTDSAAVSLMVRYVQNEHYQTPIFKNNQTNEMFSYATFVANFNE
jgi:hypothetical protein